MSDFLAIELYQHLQAKRTRTSSFHTCNTQNLTTETQVGGQWRFFLSLIFLNGIAFIPKFCWYDWRTWNFYPFAYYHKEMRNKVSITSSSLRRWRWLHYTNRKNDGIKTGLWYILFFIFGVGFDSNNSLSYRIYDAPIQSRNIIFFTIKSCSMEEKNFIEIIVAEIQISYTPNIKPSKRPKIKEPEDAYRLLMATWDKSRLNWWSNLKWFAY